MNAKKKFLEVSVSVFMIFILAFCVTVIFTGTKKEQDHDFVADTEDFFEGEVFDEIVFKEISDFFDTGYMVLVNRENSVSTEPDSSFLQYVRPVVPVGTATEISLHTSALYAVEKLFEAARQSDAGSFFVNSGYRCVDLQADLYDGGANRAFALPPGHSEHHTGLAADIFPVGISGAEMGNSDEGKWLAENAHNFGLILRYPRGAENITGIDYEPWHFRYVGRVHAYYMAQNNLTLEEYIALIQSREKISFEYEGTFYLILHRFAQNGMISLPAEMNYEISSDNLGGYIIIVW